MQAYRNLTAVPLMLLSLLLVLAGCSRPSSNTQTPSVTNTSAAQELIGEPAYTFGILYPAAHPFYEMITQFAEETAKPNKVQLLVKAPEEINLDQQVQMMEAMIKQKVDGIAVDPIDPDLLQPVIDRAVEAGIPVICFESDSPASKRLSFIGTDQRRGGALLGEIIDKLLKGKGMIMVENGLTHNTSHQARLEGFLEYINNRTRIQVLEVHHNEWSNEQALSDLEEMINNHPHFDAFVNLDIFSGTNSILVWKAMGLNRNAVAYGMTPEIKEALRNGQIVSVVSQNEQEWGKWIVEQLIAACEGKELPPYRDTGLKEISADQAYLFPDSD